jgi:hypothetical protein
MVGKRGLEPRLSGPRPDALTLTPHPGRDPRSRTAFLLTPNQADYRLPRSRYVPRHPGAARWRWRESNPLRRRLQGVSATSAVIPMAMRRPVQPVPGFSWASSAASPSSGRHGGPADNGAHAIEVSTSKHIHLVGGASQGPQELNPHSARVGAESPIRWLIPR